MKKALSLILAIVLCLGLCLSLSACGRFNKAKKEELLATAERFPSSEIYACVNKNLVLAKETYVGKVYRRADIVRKITEDGCYVAVGLFVPLEKEVILDLKLNQCIEIVFKIDDVVVTKDEQNGTTSTDIISDEVYYVGSTTKIPATVVYVTTSSALVKLQTDYTGYGCKFSVDLTEEQVNAYSQGDTVFVEGNLLKLGTVEFYNHKGSSLNIWYTMENAVLTHE